MTRWQHFLAAFRPATSGLAVTVVRPDRLPDPEVTKILLAAPEAHLLYRAFMQLIEDAREDAIANIADDSTSATAMAADAGGAKYLKALRDDVLNRRNRKRTSNVQ